MVTKQRGNLLFQLWWMCFTHCHAVLTTSKRSQIVIPRKSQFPEDRPANRNIQRAGRVISLLLFMTPPAVQEWKF